MDEFAAVTKLLERAAQDINSQCRRWQCVLQRAYDAGTYDHNSGVWTGVDAQKAAKARASYDAYCYALKVIDNVAQRVSDIYKLDVPERSGTEE